MLAIERQFARLEESPEVGRPFPDMPELCELIIEFGDSGYVALYCTGMSTQMTLSIFWRFAIKKKLVTKSELKALGP